MVVAHLLEQVVLDDRVGFARRTGEIGGGHPVDEIPFEHRSIASDDPAPFVGGELVGLGERREEILDRAVDVFVEWRGARSFRGHKSGLLMFWGHGPAP